MPFPSTFSSFNRPTASDKLNSPSHSALHNTVSSALGQVEEVIGLSTSSAIGSLMYDIRSPDSSGGGHVQTANKGGTGQTSFTKGDILVAQGSSVLGKVAIGSDTQILEADSTTASGVRWAQKTSPKVAISGSVQTVTNTASETSVMSVTIPGSTLGTNNAVRATLLVSQIATDGAGNTLLFRGNYGTASVRGIVASIQASPVVGNVSITLIGANTVSAQRMILQTDFYTAATPQAPTTSFLGMRRFVATAPVIESSANQTIGITATWGEANINNVLTTEGYIVEKIT